MTHLIIENVIEALDSITWYNGLAEYVIRWKDECPKMGDWLVREETYCCGEFD